MSFLTKVGLSDDRKKVQKQNIKWLLQYTKPYIGRILLVTGINIALTVLGLIMVFTSAKIIRVATAHAKASLLLYIKIYIGSILLVQIIQVIYSLLRTMLTERFSFSIRKQLYERVLRAHWQEAQKYHTGDLMTRLTSDAGMIADGVVGTIPEMITLVVELVLVFFSLFLQSPPLALFALVIGPMALLVSWWLGRKLKGLQIKVQQSESAYRSFLQESMANLVVMKAFANEDYAVDKLADLREERFFWVFKKTKYGTISSTIISMSFQLGYIVAFAYGALLISDGVIDYSIMTLYIGLVNRVQSPIMQLAQQIPRIVSVLASAERVNELLTLEEEPVLEGAALTGPVGVRMKNVSFAYADDPVLQKVNLDVKPGETIAIVGESGIGKTTLIRVILSMLKADEGEVVFYDADGKSETASAGSRRFMSYVPQGNTLISGSIRENIAMGKHDATEEEIHAALEQACCLSFVESLPQGIDTQIGEKGYGLSEGQAQRIAIARALVRKGQLLILDEATSALDEDTELSVLKGIHTAKQGPTCIVITHRRSVLKYCNREVRIKEGSIEK